MDPVTQYLDQNRDIGDLLAGRADRLRLGGCPAGQDGGVHAAGQLDQGRGRLVDFLPADAVDDAALAAPLGNELAHLGEAVRGPPHAVHEVGPIERPDEHLRIDQAELLNRL